MTNINGININSPRLDKAESIEKNEPRPSSPDKDSPRNDSIALSGTARTIDRLAGLVHQSRLDRFAEIQQMLASGTYSVSSTDIAHKLIESHRT
jgi:anti-sigma28 factor (negative regulator of flagellin synthesis)